jgi:hypothetical protein
MGGKGSQSDQANPRAEKTPSFLAHFTGVNFIQLAQATLELSIGDDLIERDQFYSQVRSIRRKGDNIQIGVAIDFDFHWQITGILIQADSVQIRFELRLGSAIERKGHDARPYLFGETMRLRAMTGSGRKKLLDFSFQPQRPPS